MTRSYNRLNQDTKISARRWIYCGRNTAPWYSHTAGINKHISTWKQTNEGWRQLHNGNKIQTQYTQGAIRRSHSYALIDLNYSRRTIRAFPGSRRKSGRTYYPYHLHLIIASQSQVTSGDRWGRANSKVYWKSKHALGRYTKSQHIYRPDFQNPRAVTTPRDLSG